MAKVVFSVILLLVLTVYGAMFLTWNTQTVGLTALSFQGQYWVEDNIPVGYVALGGLLAGAVLMGLFVAGGYASQHSALSHAQTKVQRARKLIKQLRGRVEELEGQLASARAVREIARAAAAPPEPKPEPEPEPEAEDDDELI